MAVIDASRTTGSRIIKVDLSETELSEIRSMLSDPSLTDLYIRTEQYDGVPAALVDVRWRATRPGERADGVDRRRLDAALDRIGHEGSPAFRRALATAFDEVAR